MSQVLQPVMQQQVVIRRPLEQIGTGPCAPVPFFGVYLLRSLKQRCLNDCYVGFTVDPQRRIGQHNGGREKGGANKTHFKRPWEMVAIVYGFVDEVSALKFEWAWQHPNESKRLRGTSVDKLTWKQVKISQKLEILGQMFHCPAWRRLPLTLHVFDRNLYTQVFLKFMRALPAEVPVFHGPIIMVKESATAKRQRLLGSQSAVSSQENRRAASESEGDDGDEDFESDQFYRDEFTEDEENIPEAFIPNFEGVSWICYVCASTSEAQDHSAPLCCLSKACTMKAHIGCLAELFMKNDAEGTTELLPHLGACPRCHISLRWGDLVRPLYRLESHGRRGKFGMKARQQKLESEAEAEDEEDDLDVTITELAERAKKTKATSKVTKRANSQSTSSPRKRKTKNPTAAVVSALVDEDSEPHWSQELF